MTQIYLGSPPESVAAAVGEEASVITWKAIDVQDGQQKSFKKKLAVYGSFSLPEVASVVSEPNGSEMLEEVKIGLGIKHVARISLGDSQPRWSDGQRITISVPRSVKSIGSNAIFIPEFVEKIDLAEGLESIGQHGVQLAGEKIVLPASLQSCASGSLYVESMGAEVAVRGSCFSGFAPDFIVGNYYANLYDFLCVPSGLTGGMLYCASENAREQLLSLAYSIGPSGMFGSDASVNESRIVVGLPDWAA